MKASSGSGIVAFEHARTESRAAEIMRAWSEKGRAAARRSLRVDSIFIVSYGVFLANLGLAARHVVAARGWTGWAYASSCVAMAAVFAALCDGIENFFLLRVLEGEWRALGPRLANGFAWAKWCLLATSTTGLLTLAVVIVARAP